MSNRLISFLEFLEIFYDDYDDILSYSVKKLIKHNVFVNRMLMKFLIEC